MPLLCGIEVVRRIPIPEGSADAQVEINESLWNMRLLGAVYKVSEDDLKSKGLVKSNFDQAGQ